MTGKWRGTFAGLALLASIASAAPMRPGPTGRSASPAARIPEADRIRLAEAFRLAEAIGDGIWPGWGRVPFAIVLVTPETEFFVRHSAPPSDAHPLGWDALLKSEVSARPRTFPTGLLATFPIGGISTVVVGPPENTGSSSSTEWVVTLLHEHFHQLQEAQPGFYGRVAALGLARGDQTGMWMLNFPFPYDAPAAGKAYDSAAQALRSALGGAPPDAFLAARTRFRESVAGDDRKYLDFQLWKEGVARYTQIRVARFAGSTKYAPSPAFAALPDYATVPYATLARELEETVSDELSKLTLAKDRRLVVYPYGAGEALLLDRIRSCWRDQYFSRMFTLAPAFEAECPKQ
jgi:hypothetical protein